MRLALEEKSARALKLQELRLSVLYQHWSQPWSPPKTFAKAKIILIIATVVAV